MALRGDIPDDVRRRWRWERAVDEHGRAVLRFRGIVLDDDGIHGRGLLRRRAWAWSIVGALSYENLRGGSAFAVCVRGDPWVKTLSTFRLSGLACRALLEDCRPFVEAHGSRVMSAIDVVEMWWVAQPESRATEQ